MHTQDLSGWKHEHAFQTGSAAAERGTRTVLAITAAAMVVELVAGWLFNSMALLADGWHMGSHVAAIGLSVLAYAASRRYAQDARFAFGTWKIEVLGGFASAIFLLLVAAAMVIGSVERVLAPEPIQYGPALGVAVLGLGVNLVCALILGHAHHDHDHDDTRHAHDHEAHGGHDLNLRSAYLHVLADAATSVLAIVALLGGWLYGWDWLDPAMAIAGAIVVAAWAKGLLAETARVLLDREMDQPVVAEIRAVVELPGDPAETRLTDLHVWRVGRNAYACAMAVVTHDRALTPQTLRSKLAQHPEIVHATIEVNHCTTERRDR